MFLIMIVTFFILSFISYIMVLKPYLTIRKIKKDFQSRGYKVLVDNVNFFKQMVLTTTQQNFASDKDAQIHFKKKYQGYDIVIQNSFNNIFVWIVSIQLIKSAYNQIQFLDKSDLIKKNFQRLYGGGLVMSEGKQWKIKRKLYSQIFNFKLLQQLHPNIQEAAQNTIKNWNLQNQLDMLLQLRKMFFNIFVMSYFGKDFSGFTYKNQSYGESIVKLIQLLFQQAFSWKNILFGTKFLEKGYTKSDQQIKQRLQTVKIETKGFLLKRFQEISKNKKQSESNILSQLVFHQYFQNVSQTEKDKKIQDIVGDVLIFFLAGTDTIGSTLTATLHVLENNPQIKEKLIKEISQAEDNYQPLTIKNLKYMDAVFNQTLRLYGPANWIFVRHVTNNQTSLGEVILPKNIYLGIQTMTIHCSQQYYENPLQFNPQRWMNEKKQNPFSFVAFGGGNRNCIGQHLARIEYKIVLRKLLKNFHMKTNEKFEMEQPFVYASANNKFNLQKIK